MIKKIFNRLLRMVSQSSWAIDLRHRRRFPGVAIHTTVNMNVQGDFSCQGVNISSWSQIIVPAGATLALGDGCYIGRNVELGPEGTIRIGNRTSIQDRCIILGDVQIGEHCVFAPNIYISSGQHHFDGQPWSLIKDQDEKAAAHPDGAGLVTRQVVIEDDCWVGVNAVVMRGVTIGKGAVIGANSVVTKDVAPYAVVAGVPARELRKRLNFQPPKAIRWDVDEHMPYFYSGFQLSQTERVRNVGLGGLVVRQAACRLALVAGAGTRLAVTARLTGMALQAQLQSGGRSQALTGEFRELIFPVVGDSDLHVLEVSGLPVDAGVCVVLQSARLI